MDQTSISSDSMEPGPTNPLDESLHELVEYLTPYFNGTRTPAQAWQLFEKEQAELRGQLLAEPSLLGEYLDNYSHYVAAALFGKVEFRPGKEVRKLREDHTKISLDELRGAKCLKIDPAVRPYLDAIGADRLLKIFALCARAEQSSRLQVPKRP